MATGGGKPRQPASPAAPRALPAAPPPIPLDALIARATTPLRAPAAPSPLPRHISPHADETPSALLLSVTISHCSCGASTRHVAPYVLVRYAANAHTVHYRSTGPDAIAPSLLATLPRERRETHVNVPFCEECF